MFIPMLKVKRDLECSIDKIEQMQQSLLRMSFTFVDIMIEYCTEGTNFGIEINPGRKGEPMTKVHVRNLTSLTSKER